MLRPFSVLLQLPFSFRQLAAPDSQFLFFPDSPLSHSQRHRPSSPTFFFFCLVAPVFVLMFDIDVKFSILVHHRIRGKYQLISVSVSPIVNICLLALQLPIVISTSLEFVCTQGTLLDDLFYELHVPNVFWSELQSVAFNMHNKRNILPIGRIFSVSFSSHYAFA